MLFCCCCVRALLSRAIVTTVCFPVENAICIDVFICMFERLCVASLEDLFRMSQMFLEFYFVSFRFLLFKMPDLIVYYLYYFPV